MSRDLKLLSLALFLWAMGEGLFVFILPIYMAELGASPAQIGQLYAIGAAAMAVSLVPAGWATDRFGPKAGLVSGWAIGAVAGFFFIIANDIPVFLIGWLLYRVTAWVIPAISAYATRGRGDLPPERALTAVYSMFNAGLILSPAIGGYLGKAFGLRANFYVATIMFAVSTAVIVLLRHQPPHPPEERARPTELLGNRRFMGFMLMVFSIMTALYMGYEFAPKFLNDIKHIDVGQIGLMGTAHAAGGFALSQLLGRRPPRRMLMLAIGLLMIYGVILLQASWIGWFAVAYFLRGAYAAARSLINALVARIVPASRLGVAFGVSETVGTAGDIVAPFLAGLLYESTPHAPFWVMIALCPILIVIVGLFAPRRIEEKQNLAATFAAD
ncbi:MAG: MFS transporter [Chloroflexi bacterium]|nr:MFS transporter [Chloroflexota bacterium]